jgi:quercetin dioxygenase-like cupin family protein
VPSGPSPPPRLELATRSTGQGPIGAFASEDLNVTLLAWPAHEQTPEHVNSERDVLVVVVSGSGTIDIDGHPYSLAAHEAVLVEKGRRRRIKASSDGIRYLSIHTARGGLQVIRRGRV